MQNLARFRTTWKFGGEYLRNGWRYSKSVSYSFDTDSSIIFIILFTVIGYNYHRWPAVMEFSFLAACRCVKLFLYWLWLIWQINFYLSPALGETSPVKFGPVTLNDDDDDDEWFQKKRREHVSSTVYGDNVSGRLDNALIRPPSPRSSGVSHPQTRTATRCLSWDTATGKWESLTTGAVGKRPAWIYEVSSLIRGTTRGVAPNCVPSVKSICHNNFGQSSSAVSTIGTICVYDTPLGGR